MRLMAAGLIRKGKSDNGNETWLSSAPVGASPRLDWLVEAMFRPNLKLKRPARKSRGLLTPQYIGCSNLMADIQTDFHEAWLILGVYCEPLDWMWRSLLFVDKGEAQGFHRQKNRCLVVSLFVSHIANLTL